MGKNKTIIKKRIIIFQKFYYIKTVISILSCRKFNHYISK